MPKWNQAKFVNIRVNSWLKTLYVSRVSRVFVVTLIRVDTRDTLKPNHSWQFVVK